MIQAGTELRYRASLMAFDLHTPVSTTRLDSMGRLLDVLLDPRTLGALLLSALVAHVGLSLALGGVQVGLAGGPASVTVSSVERWMFLPDYDLPRDLRTTRRLLGFLFAAGGGLAGSVIWPREALGRSATALLCLVVVLPVLVVLAMPVAVGFGIGAKLCGPMILVWLTTLLGSPAARAALRALSPNADGAQ